MNQPHKLDTIERSVVMKFTFPASMSLDEQDVILERIKILPYEREISTPPRPEPEPDDMPRDTRRVRAYSEKEWNKKGWNDENAVAVMLKLPKWLPKEIGLQSETRLVHEAEKIINEYLARRLVGEEG